MNRKAFREGQWSLCWRTGWPDKASFQNLVAWSWMHDDERYLIAVNLSDCPVQAQVQVEWADAGGKKWHLFDLLSGVTYERRSCACHRRYEPFTRDLSAGTETLY